MQLGTWKTLCHLLLLQAKYFWVPHECLFAYHLLKVNMKWKGSWVVYSLILTCATVGKQIDVPVSLAFRRYFQKQSHNWICHGPRVAGLSEATRRDQLRWPRWTAVHHQDTQGRKGHREVSPVNRGNDFCTFPVPHNMDEGLPFPGGGLDPLVLNPGCM